MSKVRFGLQFSLSERSVRDLVDAAGHALKNWDFEQIWLSDNLQFRHSFVTLTAMALELDCNLGLGITFPYLRNPMDTASAISSITEIMKDGKFTLGVGPGGYLFEVIGERRRPAKTVKEFLKILRLLLSGGTVKFGDYPSVASYFNLKPNSSGKLAFLPSQTIPLFIAAGGPGINRVAAELADGVIINMMTPIGSRIGVRKGILTETLLEMEKTRRSSNVSTPLRKIYLVHFSVAKNQQSAKYEAVRNVCYAIAESRNPLLEKIGISSNQATKIRDAFNSGLGIEGAAKLTVDKMADAYAISGATTDCVEQLGELMKGLNGYEQIIIDLAVSAQLKDTINLLTAEVLPSL